MDSECDMRPRIFEWEREQRSETVPNVSQAPEPIGACRRQGTLRLKYPVCEPKRLEVRSSVPRVFRRPATC